MKKIILVAGVMGSGKDHFVRWYMDKYDNDVISRERCYNLYFADPLVRFVSATRNHKRLMRKSAARYENWKKNPRVRYELQVMGDALRRSFGADFFANQVRDDIIRNWDSYDTFLISDFRYVNEYEVMMGIEDAEVFVTFKNYHSDRYNANSKHSSELMAQWLLKNDFPLDIMVDKDRFYPYLIELKRDLCLC